MDAAGLDTGHRARRRRTVSAAIDHDMLAGPTLGTVDLVAIERVRNGQPTDLTDAEREYLMATYDGTAEQARQIAAALGMTRTNVPKRHEAAVKRAAAQHAT